VEVERARGSERRGELADHRLVASLGDVGDGEQERAGGRSVAGHA